MRREPDHEPQPGDPEWIERELAELGELEDGPDEAEAAWLREVLPALAQSGRPAPLDAEGLAEEVLARARRARWQTLGSWAAAAAILLAAGLTLRARQQSEGSGLAASSPTPAPLPLESPAATPLASASTPSPAPASPTPLPPAPQPTPLEPSPAPPEPSRAPSPAPPPPTPSPSGAPRPAPLTPTPTPQVGPSIPPASTPAAEPWGSVLAGQVTVERGGRSETLEVGAQLWPTDEVQLRRGTAILALGRARLHLAQRAKLQLGERPELQRGTCLVAARDRAVVVSYGGGQARFDPYAEGLLQRPSASRASLDVFVGQAVVGAPGALQACQAGQGCELREGRAPAPRAGVAAPEWLRAARAPTGQVLFDEPCHTPQTRGYAVLLGAPGPAGLRTEPKPGAAPELAICLARAQPSGLWRADLRAHLWLRCRLEAPSTLTVQVQSPDRSATWRAVVEVPAGWSELDLPLARLQPQGGAPLREGQALDYLSLQAGSPGEARPLALEHVRVYLP